MDSFAGIVSQISEGCCPFANAAAKRDADDPAATSLKVDGFDVSVKILLYFGFFLLFSQQVNTVFSETF